MKKFVFSTYGYETPTREIMDACGMNCYTCAGRGEGMPAES